MATQRTKILGLSFNQDEIAGLLATTQNIASDVSRQISTIKGFPIPYDCVYLVVTRLGDTQKYISERLHCLIHCLHSSPEPGVLELTDALIGIKRKMKFYYSSMNHPEMDTQGAAHIYWPLVAETYVVLLQFLRRMIDTMELAPMFEPMWTSSTKLPLRRIDCAEAKKSSKAVGFSDRVTARWIETGGEEEPRGDFVVKLRGEGWLTDRRAKRFEEDRKKRGEEERKRKEKDASEGK
ncbi:hypothetical protein GQ44DRAFT_720951 [Phaeosphaeriaceae sp. PMI808]|nr:hypothetical protein GQ44DRAFT_720951 [Phaeosphaeriaceae sp. PMI808]